MHIIDHVVAIYFENITNTCLVFIALKIGRVVIYSGCPALFSKKVGQHKEK